MVLAGNDVKGSLGTYQDGDLNGTTLIVNDGTGGQFQLGSDAVLADRLEYDIKDMTIGAPVLNLNGTSVNTRDSSRQAVDRIDKAIDRVASERGAVGAVVNRLQFTLNFTERAIEGVTASESTMRNADYAMESSELARSQILAQMIQSVMINSQVPVRTVMTLLAV
jgi:flagellin